MVGDSRVPVGMVRESPVLSHAWIDVDRPVCGL
jgi:hypothetical protein